MEEYYLVYGWIYNNDAEALYPVPWCVTGDKKKAIRYFSANTDESLQLVIVHTKLNSGCLNLNKVSEGLELYANSWEGNKLAWSEEEWEELTANYSDKDPKIFELEI